MMQKLKDFNVVLLVLAIFYPCLIPAVQVVGATAGVDPSTGARPARYEINTLSQEGPAWDLFVLALQEFQTVDQSDELSYFQIAGIHGYPIAPWDGVVGSNGANYPGYCMHASVAFPTWHRPYLALYEQVLARHAINIARQYPIDQRETYLKAANNLRVPYWDWVISPELPDVVVSPTLTVNTPSGIQSIQNPLQSYEFHTGADELGLPPWHPVAGISRTVRHYDQSTQQSNQSQATLAMQSTSAGVLSTVYQLLTSVKDYTAFSCTWPGGKTNGANNVENIHNVIHNNLGGSIGHITYPETAGFDPVFWLHHANVDRLFAIWQALNPSSYIVPTTNAFGSYYETVGTLDASNTTLAPFHSGNSTALFTSGAVRSTALFGYTYPELVDWNVSASTLAAIVRTKVNQLYNPSTGFRLKSRKVCRSVHAGNIGEALGQVTLEDALTFGVNDVDTQWSIRVEVDRYAAKQSFVIYFFVGRSPADPKRWPTAPNLAGVHAQFIAANVTRLYNKATSGGLQGEISITHMLLAGVARGYLTDLGPESVVPVLSGNFHWKAAFTDGCEADLGQLSGLSITVFSREVARATVPNEFPTYGPRTNHPSITSGKIGGSH